MAIYDVNYWDFTPTVTPDEQYLHISNYGGRIDFTPSLNSNDFSIVAVIEPDEVAVNEDRGILTKWSSGTNKGWRLIQKQGNVVFSVSPNKGYYEEVSVGGLAAGMKSFVAGVFHYVPPYGPYSFAKVFCDDNDAEYSSIYGPVADNSLIYPWIARCQGFAQFDGKIYWLAYYNKMLSDAEIADLRSDAKTPQEVSDLYGLITFDREVALTYEMEVGLGPNAPYIWNVNGLPVKGTEATDDTAILEHQFGVQLPSSNILSHQFTVLKKMKRYRGLSFRDRITFKRTV